MYQPRVECGPHCPLRPVVSSEKREIFAAPPKMHRQPEHPGQRAGQAGAGRGGASGMQAGAREAGPGPRSPPPLKDPGLHPAETTSCSPSPTRSSQHLLNGIQTPSFQAFHDLHPHMSNTASESERKPGPVAGCPRSTRHRGGPEPLPGAKELQESRFCLFPLFTVLSPSDQNRVCHIVGA